MNKSLEIDIKKVSQQLYEKGLGDYIISSVYEHRKEEARKKLLEFLNNKFEYKETGEPVKRHHPVIGDKISIDDAKRLAKSKSITLTSIIDLHEELEKNLKIRE